MDGVLTDTASVHAKAWKQTFDELLKDLGRDDSFDARKDYEATVDGKSRLDGVRSFLQSRDIELPEGSADDPADAQTINGVGKKKNDLVLELIRTKGVDVYPGSVQFLRDARERGYKTAVVSSSANAREALESVKLEDLFDTWVDGVRIAEEKIKGKPAPDGFLTAAKDLGCDNSDSVVFEDALAGVQAGRAGDFAWVVGVDRTDHAEELKQHGADVVVTDLSEIDV